MCWSALTRRTSARLVGMMALTILALAMPASAAWASTLHAAAPLTAPQGTTITISGVVGASNRCPAGMAIQLTSTPAMGTTNLFTNGLGPTVPRDASGAFHASVVIPATTPVGSYTIGIVCNGSNVEATQVLNVTAAPHANPSIAVSPASAPPGASVTISGVLPTAGSVFCPSGDATVLTSTAALFPPDGFSPQVPRDASGNFRTTYTIPATTTPGSYSIGLRCGGGNVGVTATLQVTAAATTTTSAPSTTTTSTPATTTVAPTTTVPVATTVAPPPTTLKAKPSRSSPLRWVALAVLGLVVLGAAAVVFAHRRGSALSRP
jgi:hypothetical protein